MMRHHAALCTVSTHPCTVLLHQPQCHSIKYSAMAQGTVPRQENKSAAAQIAVPPQKYSFGMPHKPHNLHHAAQHCSTWHNAMAHCTILWHQKQCHRMKHNAMAQKNRCSKSRNAMPQKKSAMAPITTQRHKKQCIVQSHGTSAQKTACAMPWPITLPRHKARHRGTKTTQRHKKLRSRQNATAQRHPPNTTKQKPAQKHHNHQGQNDGQCHTG